MAPGAWRLKDRLDEYPVSRLKLLRTFSSRLSQMAPEGTTVLHPSSAHWTLSVQMGRSRGRNACVAPSKPLFVGKEVRVTSPARAGSQRADHKYDINLS